MTTPLSKKYIVWLIMVCFGAFVGVVLLCLWIQYPGFWHAKEVKTGDQIRGQNTCAMGSCGSGQQIVPTQKPVTMLAVGDIMLSRSVAGAMDKKSDPLLPFSQLADLMNSVDFSFGNLETPITKNGGTGKSGSLVFNTPHKYAVGLKKYGFEVLNLANNHAYDQGKEGLLSTIEYLEENSIKSVGVGVTQIDAWTPVIQEVRGTKICFIGASYSSINDGGQEKNENIARIDNPEKLETSVRQARGLCDFVVVTMHAGTEYTRIPNTSQKSFARTALAAGADIVIGAHPHWIQTIERYCPYQIGRTFCEEPKYIFYSLGNFIFDQEWSQETKEGLMLQVRFQKQITPSNMVNTTIQDPPIAIELMPVIIENYSTPRLADTHEASKIIMDIGERNMFLKSN